MIFSEELLNIDKATGLSYCMDMEDFYAEVLEAFCKQCEEYIPQLEEQYEKGDWMQYAIIAHGLKSNSLNIGAVNFSKLSLKHELAGKEGNSSFIISQYPDYMDALKGLLAKAKNIISK